MTSPQQSHASAEFQILLELGKMQSTLAAMETTLKALPDHETRIRALEKWRYGLPLAAFMSASSLVVGAYGWLHR